LCDYRSISDEKNGLTGTPTDNPSSIIYIHGVLMQKRFALKLVAAVALAAAALSPALAQDKIKFASIVELSGAGASSGTQFNNGLQMAIKEINAAGGILGKQIEVSTNDTTTQPGVALALTKKAIDQDVFAIFGPVFSGSINVSMKESQKAEIPNFTGGEAANITMQGNPYIFRTSFTQATAMPKAAAYIKSAKIKNLAIIYVNNDFGKGGLEMMKKSLAGSDTKIVGEISTDSAQVDFSAAVVRAKQSNADALFMYINEDESARALKELRKQGWTKPIIGETTLTGQKVIDLAGEAANGAVAHVGLTADAPIPALLNYKVKYSRAFGHDTDHNGIKGYTAAYILKAAVEKVGKLDRKAVAKAMHGIKIDAAKNPGVLMNVGFDEKGDLDRESFLVEVKNGKGVVVAVLPPLNADNVNVKVGEKKAPVKK
jgi:branched-chain amino acid transport system substrate-binding protein